MSEGSGLPVYPFDAPRCIGSIIQVGPGSAKVNLPHAGMPTGRFHHGHRVGAGEVGELVAIECDHLAIFGRVIEVRLPERERLAVEPELGTESEMNPLGTVQLLTTIDLEAGEIVPGIPRYPRLGSRVYSAHPDLVRWIIESPQHKGDQDDAVVLRVAELPTPGYGRVALTPERLLGRHLAILGATGGGKSWSLARVIQEAGLHKAKLLLLDASGEHHKLSTATKHVFIGEDPEPTPDSEQTVFPHSELTEPDLFAIFTPSGQSQAPKLRASIKSLKLVKCAPDLGEDGIVKKANQARQPYESAYETHLAVVESTSADFDITKLTKQIEEECVWPTARNDASKWGQPNEQERSYCVPLINRIEHFVHSDTLACIFQPQDKTSITKHIDDFLEDESLRILRVSLKYVSFEHNAREIVANAIGRYVLHLARAGKFRDCPLVVFLDEAHQFLNKFLGDEFSRYSLDAFGLIAKEGRKYGLAICISTQRPRDIPEDVLSQIGTLIVHRVINDRDREVVERACGEIDRSAVAFLPTLAPGEAVIVGADIPIPLALRIERPDKEPESAGPDYQHHWSL